MTLLLTVLVLGTLASLSPSTIVVFILLLATTRAKMNATAFLVGWTLSLAVVFLFAYVAGDQHSLQHGGGHTAVEVIEILLGVGLMGVGARRWRIRHEPQQPTSARSQNFANRLKDLNPIEACIVGVLEQPWTITAAAAVIVVHHQAAFVVALLAFVVFTVASTATVGVTYLYYARQPGEAQARLDDVRARVAAAGPTLFAAASLAVGAFLIVDGALALGS